MKSAVWMRRKEGEVPRFVLTSIVASHKAPEELQLSLHPPLGFLSSPSITFLREIRFSKEVQYQQTSVRSGSENAAPLRSQSQSHLGDLPHVLNGGPFIWELGKYFLNFGNEAVDVDVGQGPALWEVELWNAFTQRCGDGLLRPHLGLRPKTQKYRVSRRR